MQFLYLVSFCVFLCVNNVSYNKSTLMLHSPHLVVSFQDAMHLRYLLTADCLDDKTFVVRQLEGRAAATRCIPVNRCILAQ